MVLSKSNVLHVRFMAEPKAVNSTFSILYTAFREKKKDECKPVTVLIVNNNIVGVRFVL